MKRKLLSYVKKEQRDIQIGFRISPEKHIKLMKKMRADKIKLVDLFNALVDAYLDNV